MVMVLLVPRTCLSVPRTHKKVGAYGYSTHQSTTFTESTGDTPTCAQPASLASGTTARAACATAAVCAQPARSTCAPFEPTPSGSTSFGSGAWPVGAKRESSQGGYAYRY